MRILLINKYHFIKGGADRVYFNTGKLLEDNKHEVLYFSTAQSANFESRFSEFFVPYVENRQNNFARNILNSGRYIYNKAAYKNLNDLIDSSRPDIAHLHLFYGDLSASILKLLKKKDIPIVHTVHDYRLLCPANSFLDANKTICEKCKNQAYYQCTSKRCIEGNFFHSMMLSVEAYVRKYVIDHFDYIDRFIFVSKFAEQKHIEFNGRYSGKAIQLYNFAKIPTQATISKPDSYLLFIGRLVKEKGLITLLNAIRDIEIDLKIAGTGPLEKEVIKYAESNKHIDYLGHQSEADLKDLIKGSSYVVVPSEWYENNPMAVIEAYTYGKPVIASRIGGIPEIVLDDQTGFLFESKNETDLASVIMKAKQVSSSRYAELSDYAGKFNEQNFSPEKHYLKLLQIYSDVISR